MCQLGGVTKSLLSSSEMALSLAAILWPPYYESYSIMHPEMFSYWNQRRKKYAGVIGLIPA